MSLSAYSEDRLLLEPQNRLPVREVPDHFIHGRIGIQLLPFFITAGDPVLERREQKRRMTHRPFITARVIRKESSSAAISFTAEIGAAGIEERPKPLMS